MTKIKLCGLFRTEDAETANELRPEYVGFVFAKGSKRYVEPSEARKLRRILLPEIKSVGVFLKDDMEKVAEIAEEGIIDLIQLHGGEGKEYIGKLREHTKKPIIEAFTVRDQADVRRAQESSADMILLDAGAGEGETFDWSYLMKGGRPYFLAGGLDPENVALAVEMISPYAVDVSSGIESGGKKDRDKMIAFVKAVRNCI